MSLLPNSGRPKISRADVASIVAAHAVKDAVVIVGIRGYYKRTMGNPKRNDLAAPSAVASQYLPSEHCISSHSSQV